MNVSDIIKEVLGLRGWTQKQFAEECGYTAQGSVGGILANKKGMRTDVLVKWAKVLGCEVVIRDKMGSGKEWKIG